MCVQLTDDLRQKLQVAQLLAMDVDGVLTDGKIIYNTQGDETKAFFVQDGVGIKALQKIGMTTAIITGRTSPMVAQRAKELAIDHVIQGRDDKFAALATLAGSLDIPLEHCVYIGDDLPDIKAIIHAGVGVSVANGAWIVKQYADIITCQTGGNGAVRELCDWILSAKGEYAHLLAGFIHD